MDGWGEYYDELWLGMGSSLPSGVLVSARNDTKTVFFHGDFGLMSAQKIETLEFDGWEVFDGLTQKTTRFESKRDAQVVIVQAFLERIEEETSGTSA